MPYTPDYTSLRTWYAGDEFPSEYGPHKILGLIVVPALKKVLARLGVESRFNDFDFVLYQDRRERCQPQDQYLVVLAFDLSDALAFKCHVYPESSGFPTAVFNTAGAIRMFTDVVNPVQVSYESL